MEHGHVCVFCGESFRCIRGHEDAVTPSPDGFHDGKLSICPACMAGTAQRFRAWGKWYWSKPTKKGTAK